MECTWIQLDSLGLTWTHLDKDGFVQIGGATRIEPKATPIRETILLAIPKENV